jgi:N-acetylmuramoyl-L-alanine amidase
MSSDAGSIPAASTILSMRNARRYRAGRRVAVAAIAILVLAAAPPFSPPSARAQARQRTIVIDPGHGGLDVGAKGQFGAQEKDITLALSFKLQALIEKNLNCRVVLARDKNIDVSLENRAAVANNNDAALFISIHTNGSFRKKAHGAETFFLSLNATDEETRKLAYLENSSSELEGRIAADSQDDIKMILWDMAQSAYIRQSGRLAQEIQNELNKPPLGIENRGIKQAPFKVLTGVACPAVLVEVAFISSPEEERELVQDEFQNNVAEAIFRGVATFIRSTPIK